MKRELGFFSEQGLRDYQQDSCASCTINDATVIVIADGNQGYGGYELARTACKSCISTISFELAQSKSIDSEEHLKEIGLNAVKRATREVRIIKDQNNWADPGTTITLVIITPKYIGTFWVGDSPAYLFDSDYLVQLNHPVHTLAEKLISEGQSRKEVEKQPALGSTLTRCAGYDECEPDSKIIKIKLPFTVIAGSDGALNYCPKTKIIQSLKKKLAHACNIDEVALQIINDALENNSDDNCTVVAGHFYTSAKLITKRLTRIYEGEIKND